MQLNRRGTVIIVTPGCIALLATRAVSIYRERARYREASWCGLRPLHSAARSPSLFCPLSFSLFWPHTETHTYTHFLCHYHVLVCTWSRQNWPHCSPLSTAVLMRVENVKSDVIFIYIQCIFQQIQNPCIEKRITASRRSGLYFDMKSGQRTNGELR